MITQINSVRTTGYTADKTIPSTASQTQETETNAVQTKNCDVYESSEQQTDFCVSYGGETYTSGAKLVDRLKAEQEAQTARFFDTVKNSILKQAGQTLSGDDIWKFIASGNYTVDAATQLEAKNAIAEDGYWGVEQTAQRLVGFAKALVGGDASRLEEMKNAMIKGFEAAGVAWGSDLPDITSQTYDRAMELFDEWAKEGAGQE